MANIDYFNPTISDDNYKIEDGIIINKYFKNPTKNFYKENL